MLMALFLFAADADAAPWPKWVPLSICGEIFGDEPDCVPDGEFSYGFRLQRDGTLEAQFDVGYPWMWAGEWTYDAETGFLSWTDRTYPPGYLYEGFNDGTDCIHGTMTSLFDGEWSYNFIACVSHGRPDPL